MPVVISLLRGVNVGGHNIIKMEALRGLYESLGMQNVQTHLQSGNVVFRTKEPDLVRLSRLIEDAIEKRFGFRRDVILRTPAEARDVIARNPFAKRRDIDPSRLLVTFLATDPGTEARERVSKLDIQPDELYVDGREVYIYFVGSMASPQISWTTIAKMLKTPGTGRNWNTVTKLLEIADKLEQLGLRPDPGKVTNEAVNLLKIKDRHCPQRVKAVNRLKTQGLSRSKPSTI